MNKKLISNTELLQNKNPQQLQDFANWDDSDYARYRALKQAAEFQHGRTGQWNQEWGQEAQGLRDKYGLTEDSYGAKDLLDTQERRIGLGTHSMVGLDSGSNYSSSSNSGGYSGGSREFVMPPLPTLRSGRSMAELLGVDYDYDNIHDSWKDAAEKKYANLDAEYGRTQDMYYDTAANNADILMGAMRRGDRDAVMAGTSQGTQASQELSALLGMSADAAQGATELAQGRSDLVNQRETELANVTKDAMKYYNELGVNLGQLSASELNALTQAFAAQVATAGGVYNTDVLADVERDRIASTETIAAGDRLSRENIAMWGHESAEAIAAANNMTTKEVEEARGEWNKAVADVNSKGRSSSYASSGGQPIAAGSQQDIDMMDEVYTIYSEFDRLEGKDDTRSKETMKMLTERLSEIFGWETSNIEQNVAKAKQLEAERKRAQGTGSPNLPNIGPRKRSDYQDAFMNSTWRGRR